jgi:hypothetical protein
MTTRTNESRPTHRVCAVTKTGDTKLWQPIAMWAHTNTKGFNLRIDYAREFVLASLRPHQDARNDKQLPLFQRRGTPLPARTGTGLGLLRDELSRPAIGPISTPTPSRDSDQASEMARQFAGLVAVPGVRSILLR